MISIIIPTYNEKENIESLVRCVFKVFRSNNINGEIVIVDDDSPNGTGEVAEKLKKEYPIVICHRRLRKGLASAVIDGFIMANGDILGVMDADLSHDVELIPVLINTLKEGNADIAIGSRYTKGGGIDKTWPLKRKIVSYIASLLARPLIKIKDPLSGFFFFKKDILNRVKLNDYGFKICLEILVKAKYQRVKEIPYIFRDRKRGKSKIDYAVILGYIFQLIDLYIFHFLSNRK